MDSLVIGIWVGILIKYGLNIKSPMIIENITLYRAITKKLDNKYEIINVNNII